MEIEKVLVKNFTPFLSAKLITETASSSITFISLFGELSPTFKLTNKGNKGAYIGWGFGTATAIISTSTPAASCDYLAPGAILTQNFESSNGIVNTIAAIQGSDPEDNGSTIIEISVGSGQ